MIEIIIWWALQNNTVVCDVDGVENFKYVFISNLDTDMCNVHWNLFPTFQLRTAEKKKILKYSTIDKNILKISHLGKDILWRLAWLSSW